MMQEITCCCILPPCQEPRMTEDLDPCDKEYYRNTEDRDGNLSWIWRKGVDLGKKIVVTSVVVSSAPFVLPPLMALSTIGLVLSFPAGFVFVTYACGEKLMSALLPMPSPPPFEHYELMDSDRGTYEIYNDDDDDDDHDNGVGKVYEEQNGMVFEGEKCEQDAQNGLEMRKSNEEIDEYDQIALSKDDVDEGSMSEIVEEGGYEENVEESMVDEEQLLDSKVIPDILEGINEAENEISMMEKEGKRMPRDSLRAVVVEAELSGENESNVEQLIEDMAFLPPREIAQENNYVENLAGINEEELKSETTGLLEEIRDMGKIDQIREPSQAVEKPEENDVSEMDISQEMRLKDFDVIPEENEPLMDDKGAINDLNNDENSDYITFEEDETSALICDEPTSIVENQRVVNVRIDGDHTVTDVHIGDKIETSMLLSEDGTKMAEGSGFDKSNDGKVTPDLKLDSLGKTPEGSEKMAEENGFDLPDSVAIAPDLVVDSFDTLPEGKDVPINDMVEVSVEYHEVVIESTVPLYEYEENVPSQEIAPGSDKVKLAEEKVWEQLNAMRTIVGYTNTPHTSYTEELKALYTFTGVEPPISSEDSTNLADINEKLHFLMSIVGVK